MKLSNINLLCGLLLSLAILTSCENDSVTPGSSVTVTNTFQSNAFTNGAELAIEDLFQVPAGSLAATATVGDGVEFSDYLLGLYDIDIAENSISFEVVAQVGDSTYRDLFRVLEAGTVDRYYLTFEEDQNVSESTSSNAAVGLRLDSEKVLVVEIGEGFDFKPGASFTIELD